MVVYDNMIVVKEALRKAMVHYRIQKYLQLDHTLKLNMVPYSQPLLRTAK